MMIRTVIAGHKQDRRGHHRAPARISGMMWRPDRFPKLASTELSEIPRDSWDPGSGRPRSGFRQGCSSNRGDEQRNEPHEDDHGDEFDECLSDDDGGGKGKRGG